MIQVDVVDHYSYGLALRDRALAGHGVLHALVAGGVHFQRLRDAWDDAPAAAHAHTRGQGGRGCGDLVGGGPARRRGRRREDSTALGPAGGDEGQVNGVSLWGWVSGVRSLASGHWGMSLGSGPRDQVIVVSLWGQVIVVSLWGQLSGLSLWGQVSGVRSLG